jgi:predicted lipid-binding transport protein (Tim44 family)
MDQSFDPFTIILLAVTVIVLLRLRSVLGTRTGHEKRIDPFSPPNSTDAKPAAKKTDNVIRLPGNENDKLGEEPDQTQKPVWLDYATEGSALAKGLEKLHQTDRTFDPADFVQGAKVAYEMIVTSFSEGDKKSLKSLLTKDVYAGFAEAIDQRKAKGETMESRFVGIDSAELVEATLKGRIASLTVKFVSQLISATRDKQGNVIDGDPKQIAEITDIWTFERDTTSRDPNWNLSATEANV